MESSDKRVTAAHQLMGTGPVGSLCGDNGISTVEGDQQ